MLVFAPPLKQASLGCFSSTAQAKIWGRMFSVLRYGTQQNVLGMVGWSCHHPGHHHKGFTIRM